MRNQRRHGTGVIQHAEPQRRMPTRDRAGVFECPGERFEGNSAGLRQRVCRFPSRGRRSRNAVPVEIAFGLADRHGHRRVVGQHRDQRGDARGRHGAALAQGTGRASAGLRIGGACTLHQDLDIQAAPRRQG